MSVDLRGRTTARAVRCLPFTVEGRVLCQVSPCEICGGQSGTGIGFCSRVLWVSLVAVITQVLNNLHLHLRQ